MTEQESAKVRKARLAREKRRVEAMPRYQDAVERFKRQLDEATAKRDQNIRELSATHTHDQIVALLGVFPPGHPQAGKPRLTRGRIGQIAPPKRVRTDLDADVEAQSSNGTSDEDSSKAVKMDAS